MRFNQHTAVSSSRILLVPYDSRHVPKYHAWMEDPAIQEATASERLTLEEEYENQQSWRESHDKLTFILCHPLPQTFSQSEVRSGDADASERMVGDINFFVHEDDDEDVEEDTQAREVSPSRAYLGEVDIMIADAENRGKGLGKAAVSTFLHYIVRNLDSILNEYTEALPGREKEMGPRPVLKKLMVKINKDNAGSVALFKRLGFEQDGDVNYFGEVKLLMDPAKLPATAPQGYAELAYSRSWSDAV